MSDEIPTFGQRIRAVRESRKLRRSDVAAYSDYEISKAGLFRIESESRINPKLTTLVALCASMGLRIEIDPEGPMVEAIEGWTPPGRPPGWDESKRIRIRQIAAQARSQQTDIEAAVASEFGISIKEAQEMIGMYKP